MPLSQILGTLPEASTEQVQSVLRAVRRHLGMDVGFISEFVGGDRVFRFSDGEVTRNPIHVGASDPLEKSFCHYIARGVMPELMQDAREDPIAAQMSVTHDLPVGAHLSVPLYHFDGTLFGTLCCFSFTPDRSLTSRDLGILRMCADVVSAVLQSERRAARDRKAQYERVAQVIETQAMSMVYQPIYRVSDGRLIAFEALARFDTEPKRSPDTWFADAAEAGLGEELEFLALQKALEAFPMLDPSLRLAVNLSPASVMSSRFTLALADAPLDRTVIELTEHAAVACYDALKAALAPLRTGGLRLAVDDVGAGHSTFRHVLDLAPELIKLDRSLIRDIGTDSARRALAEALTRYSRRMGCEVVAEGVETQVEYMALKDLGVTRVQGFLLGRHMPVNDAVRLPLQTSF